MKRRADWRGCLKAASCLSLLLCTPIPAQIQAPVLLADINRRPAPNGSSWPHGFAPLGTLVCFSAYTESTGRELFWTDGTPQNTGLVREIVPGPDSSSPRHWVPICRTESVGRSGTEPAAAETPADESPREPRAPMRWSGRGLVAGVGLL